MVAAQSHVPVTPQPRHALLEEFTGIKCMYCPEGHKVAAQLLEAYPEQMDVISVHYGSFAHADYDDQPDFITEAGDEIGGYYDPQSFPSGMINRRDYLGNGVVTYRSMWPNQAAEYIAQTASVNLWTESHLDPATRSLTIDVEGYVREACPDTEGSLYLAVALLQDSILGPQKGGMMGDEYPHCHVLRDYLTPTWGDSLGLYDCGAAFVRHYAYEVPTAYKNTEVELQHLELCVILTNEAHEVVQSMRCRPVVSSWHVATGPQQRHALLEDFTGIYCGNCPDGHAIVERLLQAQPEYVHAISIHSGHYAEPTSAAMPDFRTAAGDSISDYFGANAYPTGMINRCEQDGTGVVTGRGVWSDWTRRELQHTAGVNLWMQSRYEAATRTLSVDVEGYVLEPDTLSLAVALTQSHIMAFQNGAVNSGNYDHQHVLRDYLTPVWGEPLGRVEAGSYFSRHYDYVVPDSYANTAAVPEYMELIAIASNQQREVVNSLACRPQSSDFTLPLQAKLEAAKVMPSRNWGYNFVEVVLDNRGAQDITSATFDVMLNDETVQTPWHGCVPALTRQTLRLPVDWLSTQIDDRNDYEISLTHLNDETCEMQQLTGKFNGLIEVTGNVVVKIKADYHASDNRFLLCDTLGNVLQECGPYADSTRQVTYVDTLRMEPGRIYAFDITDAWGDGILTPRGNIKWYDEEGQLLASQPELSGFGYRIFFHTADAAPEAIEEVKVREVPTGVRFVIGEEHQLMLIDTRTGRRY